MQPYPKQCHLKPFDKTIINDMLRDMQVAKPIIWFRSILYIGDMRLSSRHACREASRQTFRNPRFFTL